MRSYQYVIRSLSVCLFILMFSSVLIAGATYYVDDDAPNDPGPYDPNVSDPLMDGSADHPFDNVQEGIDASVNGDIVTVLPGTYYENITFFTPGDPNDPNSPNIERNIILTSTNPNDPNVVDATIIDGNQNESVVTFFGSETPACILRGFTIRNGYADGGDQHDAGGGIFGNETHATISNCIISGNTADYGGGLHWCYGVITNCTITGNTAGWFGGGLGICEGQVTNCLITGNTARHSGGGLWKCNSEISNCTITGNSTNQYGGGLAECNGPITNCIITGNNTTYYAPDYGGGGLAKCNGPIANCTIINNSSAAYGGGLTLCDGTITNCIIWNNDAVNQGDQLRYGSTPTYSCIQDWTGGGTGNISSDPTFVDTTSASPGFWDLHLLPVSPCIDAGTNTPPGGLPATDIEGTPRPFDGDLDSYEFADMGAYEFRFSDEPYVYCTPLSFGFSGYEGEDNPVNQFVTIKNYGNQILNWTLNLDGLPGWLAIAPTSGSLALGQNENIALSVDITGLSGGQYSYAFEVSDPVAQNSPQTITVDLEVIGPIMQVSETNFSYAVYEDAPNPEPNILTISNSGGGTLNWSAGLTFKPDWLTVTPTSSSLNHNENTPVMLSVDITGLSGGQYSYSFDVVDPSAQNSPQTITVDLEVIGPIMQVSETNFSYAVYEDAPNPDPNILTISNSGGGTVNWSITDANEVTFSPPAWLTITPTSGSLGADANEPVTLSADITGLSGGQYFYSFQVIDTAAQNSPQIINVNLRIAEEIYVPADYSTIQAAIDAAINGDSVIVSPGTYYENINFNGKNIILTSTDPEGPNTVAATIIDGERNGHVVEFVGSENSSCKLQGFTITNGYATGINPNYCGGGIFGNNTEATISNCTITQNEAYRGGGLYRCKGLITNCVITNNTTNGLHGGGLFDCDGIIVNCRISGNTSSSYGGGLSFCDGIIVNCTISGNTSLWDGGGLAYCDGSIINCTIAANSADRGGGLFDCDGSITNCIIWENSAFESGGPLYFSSVPTYSCIQNWTGGGIGNITNDPLFADTSSADPNDWDLSLKSQYGRWQSARPEYIYFDPNDGTWVTVPAISGDEWVYDDVTSPCIDAGNPNAMEWQNELWPHGGRINMGAYGGTPQASMSPNPVGNVADLDHDNVVGVTDLELFCNDWLYAEYLLDTDLNHDGVVDFADWGDFTAQWLWTEP